MFWPPETSREKWAWGPRSHSPGWSVCTSVPPVKQQGGEPAACSDGGRWSRRLNVRCFGTISWHRVSPRSAGLPCCHHFYARLPASYFKVTRTWLCSQQAPHPARIQPLQPQGQGLSGHLYHSPQASWQLGSKAVGMRSGRRRTPGSCRKALGLSESGHVLRHIVNSSVWLWKCRGQRDMGRAGHGAAQCQGFMPLKRDSVLVRSTGSVYADRWMFAGL